ncbi:MAG: hypothetical protein AABY53_07830 [Bdellovibrionota bacterium]
MKKKHLILFLISLGFATDSFAKKEDWYWGLSVGTGTPTFTGAHASTISTLSADPAFSSSTSASEFFLYFPSYGEGVLGVAAGGISKAFKHTTDASQNQFFGQSLLTASWLHSSGKEPGNGLLLRADVGYGSVFQTSGTSLLPTAGGTNAGLAVRAGLGYGFTLGENTRIMFLATVATVSSSGNPNYYALSVGPLF